MFRLGLLPEEEWLSFSPPPPVHSMALRDETVEEFESYTQNFSYQQYVVTARLLWEDNAQFVVDDERFFPGAEAIYYMAFWSVDAEMVAYGRTREQAERRLRGMLTEHVAHPESIPMMRWDAYINMRENL